MEDKKQYQALMSDIINKQIIILGPQIAILKARNVQELVIDDNGQVTDIKGEPAVTLQKLVDEYVELSGMIVKNALGSIFAKYPTIKKVE